MFCSQNINRNKRNNIDMDIFDKPIELSIIAEVGPKKDPLLAELNKNYDTENETGKFMMRFMGHLITGTVAIINAEDMIIGAANELFDMIQQRNQSIYDVEIVDMINNVGYVLTNNYTTGYYLYKIRFNPPKMDDQGIMQEIAIENMKEPPLPSFAACCKTVSLPKIKFQGKNTNFTKEQQDNLDITYKLSNMTKTNPYTKHISESIRAQIKRKIGNAISAVSKQLFNTLIMRALTGENKDELFLEEMKKSYNVDAVFNRASSQLGGKLFY